MNGIIPITDMYHLGVVTNDFKRSMENYSRVFGIPKWEIRYLTDDRFKNPRVHGKHVKQNFVSALAIGGPLSFELCEPRAGDRTLYAEFLEEKGPGLHHISPTLMSEEEFKALLPEMEKRGLKFNQSAEISDTVDYWYVDAEAQTGTLIELLVIKGPNPEGTPPDEIISFGPEITQTPDKLPIDKLYHYTVAARQPAEHYKRGYEDLFGIAEWYDFENKPNETVHDARYNGRPGDFRFRTWSGRKGALGVEIVEPQGGGSIFEEKLRRNGAGMHHIMTTITNAEQWEKTSKWLAAEGMPIAQDAWTPDGSTYVAFIDAREKLDNMYLEVLVRQDDSVAMEGPIADILIGG
ncbi:VOC family protein [Rhizorhabdus argentea]|uniref:VOC family protein n=1 Tax=Rhizorhabdus argentea TaxID=1387174 RepID=UPI0030EF9D69